MVVINIFVLEKWNLYLLVGRIIFISLGWMVLFIFRELLVYLLIFFRNYFIDIILKCVVLIFWVFFN